MLEQHKGKLLFSFAIVFNFVVLFFTLKADYFGDDIYNMQVHGAVPDLFPTVFDMIIHNYTGWLESQGRFFPLAWYGAYVFWYFDTLFSYKLFILITIVLSVISFAYFIYKLSGEKRYFYILLIVTPILFQVRMYHDPILSFNGLIQLLFLYTIISLIFFDRYLDSNSRTSYLISIVLFNFALLTYEISYIFFVFYFILMYRYQSSIFSKVIRLSPFLISVLIWGSVSLYLRSNATGIVETYTPNFDIFIILKTFFYQIASSFPTTYHAGKDNSAIFSIFNILVSIGFILLIIIVKKLFSETVNKNQNNKNLIILSLAFIILPATIISLSPKFQSQLSAGIGYLPVFIQYFGVALLVTILLIKVKKTIFKVVIYFILFAISLDHLTSNNHVANQVNETYKYKRLLLEKFLKDESDLIPKSSKIFLDHRHQFHTREFFNLNSKKMYELRFDNKIDLERDDFRLKYDIKKINEKYYAHIILSSYLEKMSFYYRYDDKSWGKIDKKDYFYRIVPDVEGIYGWEGEKGRWAWSSGNVKMKVKNLLGVEHRAKLSFFIGTLAKRDIKIYINNQEVSNFDLNDNESKFIEKDILLNNDTVIVNIITSQEAVGANNSDKRVFTFNIKDLKLKNF